MKKGNIIYAKTTSQILLKSQTGTLSLSTALQYQMYDNN